MPIAHRIDPQKNLFPNDPDTTIEGTLEQVRFVSADDAWSVVTISLSDSGRRIAAVGNLAGVQVGEILRLTGRWTVHPRFGERFEVKTFQGAKPVTVEGIEKYLGSGLVKGVGHELASRLVRRFGEKTLDVIGSSPERLREVPGIGEKKSRQIVEAWAAQKGVRDLMVFLQSYGASTSLAARIFSLYGGRARELIEANPYRLADDIPGVGFQTADRIAQKLEGSAESPHRLAAGAVFTLKRMAEDGHTLVPRKALEEECARLLGVAPEKCAAAIIELSRTKGIVLEDSEDGPRAALPDLYLAETQAAEMLAHIAAFPLGPDGVGVDAEAAAFERQSALTLSPLQRDALRHARTDKVLVITGGPGTGKTTLLKAVLQVLGGPGRTVALCAPTGRAAKRMEEAAGRDAKTIHRLLEYGPQKGGFARNASNPLACDVCIADEASMIDVMLFHALLLALPLHCRLILVGDKDQLPSVGPGNVLGDLIGSHAVPVVHLTEVFRQAEASSIVVNAHRINAGLKPVSSPEDSGDFFFIERHEPGEILDTLHELVTRRIPRRFGMDPMRDIQVLTPMQRGDLGAVALNAFLQNALNPSGPSIERGSRVFRTGDRVMQLRNDYERGVWNGDIGSIASVDTEARVITVRYDDRDAVYEWADLDGISPAYACTIHKSQGSEFPAVVIVLHTQAYVLLARNLLYTAATRGRRLTVIVGSEKALAIAVKNASAGARRTGLADKLSKAFQGRPLP
jgi:exodeoxyribonuclease V alpha subunit